MAEVYTSYIVEDGITSLQWMVGDSNNFKRHLEQWFAGRKKIFPKGAVLKNSQYCKAQGLYAIKLFFPSTDPDMVVDSITRFDIDRAEIILLAANKNIKKAVLKRKVSKVYHSDLVIRTGISDAKRALLRLINKKS